MTWLPVIVGVGGINCAGRSSGFHNYKRMISEVLSDTQLETTWRDLANRMGIDLKAGISSELIEKIKKGTLVRKIETFNTENVSYHHKAKLNPELKSSFIIHKNKLPKILPETWCIEEINHQHVKVFINEETDIFIPYKTCLSVTAGGTIPTGFDVSKLYHSHHHPRGLKLALYGAQDALNLLGIEWDEILTHIKPDEVAVYAGSAIAQLDEHSLIGLISQPLLGNRISSKMLPLSLVEMPADFINSYIINSVGTTGTNVGACATFLYNLRQGMTDIQTGKAKVVIIGNAEAPLVPEVIEGFAAMGALAKDEDLCALDNSQTVDYKRACRPFSSNAGFTLAESAQFLILMNDELALKLGANIYGSVADIFINADANKKSISSPGIGNYITVAKATALAKTFLGQRGLAHTFVQAHGSGTPQNRTTESHILNEVAKIFGIDNWPIAAIKSYVGHSMSAAGGDQIIAALGVWQHGWIPGIKTIDHIAEDVHCSHLNILMDHHFVGERGSDMHAALINSKGFGGNNATGLILSPQYTLNMLQKKYGLDSIKSYQLKNKSVSQNSHNADLKISHGEEKIRYRFGEAVMDQDSVTLTTEKVALSQFTHSIDLPMNHAYQEYV